MICSKRAQKAERVIAARRLLATEIGLAEAAMALSRVFGLSRRQAYRYPALADSGAPSGPSECCYSPGNARKPFRLSAFHLSLGAVSLRIGR